METERRRAERRSEVLRVQVQAACLATALEHLPHPILLLAEASEIRVWHANAAARRELVAPCAIRLENGVLRDDGSASARRFLREVRAVFQSESEAARTVQVTLQPRTTPGRSVYLERLEFSQEAGDALPPMVLVEIPERVSHEQALQRLCGEFELTPKEAEIALKLYANGSVTDLARLSGKSIHTVRAQLKSAMQKTNTRTQAALVALVSSRLGG